MNIKIFSTNTSSQLYQELTEIFDAGKIVRDNFPNKECRILVEDKEHIDIAVLLVSGISNFHKKIVENILLADALKRMKVKKIIAVVPWLYYSPQDKVFREGEPLSSEVIAQFFDNSGIHELICFDLHSELTKDFFKKIKLVELSAIESFAEEVRKVIKKEEKYCVVSFDKGSLKRAKKFSELLGTDLVKFDKFRDRETGEVTFKQLEGNVKGKHTVSFDDFVSTGGTRLIGSQILKTHGGLSHTDCVTHVIVPETLEKIQNCKTIDKFLMTNSTEVRIDDKRLKIKTISIANTIADYLRAQF